MFDWIWDEEIWFPDNSTGPRFGWKDLTNQPGSDIYYPQSKDLHWSFLLGAALLAIRYLLEIVLIEPVGYKIGVPRQKPVACPKNPVLENAFKQHKHFTTHLIQNLAKQTDMTVRQIEIWLRDRRKMDNPTKMKKFKDCSWHFIFYGLAFVYGLYVLWDKEWMWTTKYCWLTWPKQHVDSEIYWYYVIELGFYWSLVFSLFTDHKRKDFTEMIVHHVATIILIYFSWFMNFVRIGTLVLLVHDASDPWLAGAKMSGYCKSEIFKDFCFVVFIIVWVISRLWLYPFVVLYSSTVEPYYIIEKTFFVHWFFNFFLYVLMVLHIMWSYSIARILIKKLTQGEVQDVRSDSESEEEATSVDSMDNKMIDEHDSIVNGTEMIRNGKVKRAD